MSSVRTIATTSSARKKTKTRTSGCGRYWALRVVRTTVVFAGIVGYVPGVAMASSGSGIGLVVE
ncbi:hypothetical protein CQ040_15860 [Microbacterium sp. MYb54]|nr:hypothetical protein CQ032_15210 [Microbacterium sp. MYb43]PQZ75111.1 hypothetical protein CQ031_14560 [Microbacterium sp. MYb40]PRB19406.1 hypothetical protein CQ040_15860 [Microbacterium sp. MYb54]PRB24607.1 hypothetical protein CQ037_16365 [Microbacterium sp. MYb50]PRB63718.1 hypothetical protein CQ021_15970 [Microbacterium sp. MYb24]PRB69150.1 hypothetical protein CQ027_17260 [Microbacterium sp. MYb32]